MAEFVQHEREQNRGGKTEEQPQRGNKKRVAQRGAKLGVAEQLVKVVEPHPGAAKDAVGTDEFLERKDEPDHRRVVEDGEVNEGGGENQQEAAVALPDGAQTHRGARGGRERGKRGSDHGAEEVCGGAAASSAATRARMACFST